MATTYLSRTFGTPTNASKFTYSAWVKRCNLDGTQILLYANGGNAQNFSNIMFNSSNSFFWHILHSNSEISKLRSNRRLRDNNGWYHLVFQYDSTQATAANRTKMYINGVEVTSYHTQTNSGQNSNYHMNTAVEHLIGAEKGNTGGSVGNYFDGLMSHVHFVDGTIYAPSTFGETDSTTGEWKIKTSPGISTANYGNNGFWILKDGNSVTDQSGNGNNWTVAGGTLTKTEDCPSNVFATMNPIDSNWMAATFSNGNNTVVTQGSHRTSMAATLGASSGKYYWEVKYVSNNSGDILIGIDTKGASTCTNFSSGQCDEFTGYRAYGYGYYSVSGNKYNNNNGGLSYGNSYTIGDIIGVALDLDNNKLYFSKNGTWENSGDPTSGATGTGAAFTITAASSTDTGIYFPAISDASSYGDVTYNTNFGNGYFGTTAVASAGTNASGNGIFEYDCPQGYTALSTKGLNL